MDDLPADSSAALTHSSTLRRLLYEALTALGHDPFALYRRAYQGRRMKPLASGERDLHDSAPLLWQSLAGLTGDPDIGLHLGEAIRPRLLDVVGYLTTAAHDLRQALESLVRFQHILSGGLAARLEEDGRQARLIIDLDYRGFGSLRQQMECVSLILCKRLMQLTDDEFRLEGVTFRHPPPRRLAEHRRLFGLTPHFGQAHDALIFPAAQLRRLSRTSNPRLYALLYRHAEQELAELQGNALQQRVRYWLSHQLEAGACDLPGCAGALGLAPYELKRGLAAAGGFRALREEVRRERARQLLTQGEAIRVVARTCGFAELSPFYRAFRRWYGQTPEAFRRGLA